MAKIVFDHRLPIENFADMIPELRRILVGLEALLSDPRFKLSARFEGVVNDLPGIRFFRVELACRGQVFAEINSACPPHNPDLLIWIGMPGDTVAAPGQVLGGHFPKGEKVVARLYRMLIEHFQEDARLQDRRARRSGNMADLLRYAQ